MFYRIPPKSFNLQFEVVSCFFEYDEKILLLRRKKEKTQGDKWGVPAGKVEGDETITKAMIREIKEETGIDVNPYNIKYFDKVYIRHSGRDFIYHMFYTKLNSKPIVRINHIEHKDFTWIFPMEALNINLVSDLDKCLKLFYFGSEWHSSKKSI